jgi:hypothetical protein
MERRLTDAQSVCEWWRYFKYVGWRNSWEKCRASWWILRLGWCYARENEYWLGRKRWMGFT